MTNDDPLGNIPRYVLFRGKRARVLEYDAPYFIILGPRDQRFQVKRDRITFLPERKKQS